MEISILSDCEKKHLYSKNTKNMQLFIASTT